MVSDMRAHPTQLWNARICRFINIHSDDSDGSASNGASSVVGARISSEARISKNTLSANTSIVLEDSIVSQALRVLPWCLLPARRSKTRYPSKLDPQLVHMDRGRGPWSLRYPLKDLHSPAWIALCENLPHPTPEALGARSTQRRIPRRTLEGYKD
ncbi:unnamed protein product [Nesidiocoris tenuis]|uniref:Uncharacterized protein n=1 Tax=Nesidiocoris tenuis TaxID=355587 RepID=A0A6H5GZA0_9HEMI|nr:unnamed protein product [Nesidiocoris tenuis]